MLYGITNRRWRASGAVVCGREADHRNDTTGVLFVLHEIAAGCFEFFIESGAFFAVDDGRVDTESSVTNISRIGILAIRFASLPPLIRYRATCKPLATLNTRFRAEDDISTLLAFAPILSVNPIRLPPARCR